MNFEINKIRVNEIDINIKSIIAQCIKKLGTILICTLVFAILVSAIMYLKDLNNYEVAVNNQSTTEMVELTEKDYMMIETYNLLKSRLDQLSEYRDNSILMEIDFNNVYTGKLQYHVSADERIKYDVVSTLYSFVNNDVLANKMSEMEDFPEASYIQELISSSIASMNAGIETGIINIYIMGRTEQECQDYVEAVKGFIEVYSDSLPGDMAEHTLTLVQEECYVQVRRDIYEAQKGFFSEWQSADTELLSHMSTLTDAQKREIFEEEKDSVIDTTIIPPSVNVKYVVLGAILGAMLAFVVILAGIIFGGKLQSEKESLKRLNIVHFGNIYIANKCVLDKIVGKFLYGKNTLDKETQLKEISTRLQVFLQESCVKKINLISTTDEISSETIKTLADMISKRGITCEIVGNVLKDSKALEKLSSKENVVLIENIGKSMIKEIYEESITCLNAKAEVLGYISVQG